MRRTTRVPTRPPLLALAIALWAAQALLAPPPARADFILAELPAGATSVHFADQPPGDSVVGLDPTSGVGVTVSNNGGDPISGIAATDTVSIHFSTGPEGDLSITFDRPVYGVSFVFGGPSAILTAIGVNELGPNWFVFSPTFLVGPLFGTPGDRVSVLATGRDRIGVISAASGYVGGVGDLRILADPPVATPEPAGLATLAVGGMGLVGAWGWRRLRRRPRTAGSRR